MRKREGKRRMREGRERNVWSGKKNNALGQLIETIIKVNFTTKYVVPCKDYFMRLQLTHLDPLRSLGVEIALVLTAAVGLVAAESLRVGFEVIQWTEEFPHC